MQIWRRFWCSRSRVTSMAWALLTNLSVFLHQAAFLYKAASHLGLVLPAPLFIFLHLNCWPGSQGKNVFVTDLIHFPVGSQLKHRASFRVSVISHTQTHGRTPLDEWSARRRDLYLHWTTQHINSVAQEPECSSPHSQQPATGPCPEPVESNQHINTRDKYPRPELDSNPRPQQPRGHWDCLVTDLVPLIHYSSKPDTGELLSIQKRWRTRVERDVYVFLQVRHKYEALGKRGLARPLLYKFLTVIPVVSTSICLCEAPKSARP
jgi:hypothetical protein